jgi:hypothetical protein
MRTRPVPANFRARRANLLGPATSHIRDRFRRNGGWRYRADEFHTVSQQLFGLLAEEHQKKRANTSLFNTPQSVMPLLLGPMVRASRGELRDIL